jgi:hypothetical protein
VSDRVRTERNETAAPGRGDLPGGDDLRRLALRRDLVAFKDACWYSWTELTASLGNLAAYRFEWLLPGHGWPVHLPADEMKTRLLALVARMRQG